MADLTSLSSRFQNFDQQIWSETSRFFPALQKYVFTIKRLLKACHELCMIYVIFSPDLDMEIWDWRKIGVSDKNIPYFCQKLLTLLVKEES